MSYPPSTRGRVLVFGARMLKFTIRLGRRLFRPRKIIIISERKVIHYPISPFAQGIIGFLLVTLFATTAWVTGSYFAYKEAYVKRAVAHVENGLVEANKKLNQGNLSSVRVVELEKQVANLAMEKQQLIQTITQTTEGKIEDFHELLQKTGLPKSMLHLPEKNRVASPRAPMLAPTALLHLQIPGLPQGGPYIPSYFSSPSEDEFRLALKLGEMMSLYDRMQALPIATPVKRSYISSVFGRRIDPIRGRVAMHEGVDLIGPAHSHVLSSAAGKVTYAGYRAEYGNVVEISHGGDLMTRYAHLSEVLVRAGEQVGRNEVIGIQGSTGRSTGAHVHFEVRYKDRALDPEPFLEAGEYVLNDQ